MTSSCGQRLFHCLLADSIISFPTQTTKCFNILTACSAKHTWPISFAILVPVAVKLRNNITIILLVSAANILKWLALTLSYVQYLLQLGLGAARCLLGTKTLSESILASCHLDPSEQWNLGFYLIYSIKTRNILMQVPASKHYAFSSKKSI